jgi:phosphopentomutase/2,3-bisphosphoglycerate-independent phosphoglycerate mutase family metalloenzyme
MRIARILICVLLSGLTLAAQPRRTRNIILVTSDGLRWQELFGGIDPLLASEKSAGMEKAVDLRKRYERPTGKERREALMPFFWTKLAPRGVVLADVHVTNAYRVSYPGYSEILTGRANDDVIKGNDPIQNPNQTVLEYIRGKLNLKPEQVALFASWDTFRVIGEHTPGSIFINAGYKKMEGPRVSPVGTLLSGLQSETLPAWESARYDSFTFELALDYLKTAKPRVTHIALNDTDEWAHSRRYDRLLDSIANVDHCLERLWTTIQGMKEYRDSTTLIVTADHGRGSLVSDWSGHGKNVAGADRIWFAITGPDTPAIGESKDSAQQRDIAPTMLSLLGLDPKGYGGALGKPIANVVKSTMTRADSR